MPAVPWLQVTETKDYEPRTWRRHGGEARYIALPVWIRKDVEKPAVNDNSKVRPRPPRSKASIVKNFTAMFLSFAFSCAFRMALGDASMPHTS